MTVSKVFLLVKADNADNMFLRFLPVALGSIVFLLVMADHMSAFVLEEVFLPVTLGSMVFLLVVADHMSAFVLEEIFLSITLGSMVFLLVVADPMSAFVLKEVFLPVTLSSKVFLLVVADNMNQLEVLSCEEKTVEISGVHLHREKILSSVIFIFF